LLQFWFLFAHLSFCLCSFYLFLLTRESTCSLVVSCQFINVKSARLFGQFFLSCVRLSAQLLASSSWYTECLYMFNGLWKYEHYHSMAHTALYSTFCAYS
jgi:hypothetical protein